MRPIRRLATEVVRNDKGNFLVFFGLSLVALMGMVALAFDLGRAASTQTDLQSFADNVALAAAAELDGNGDSVTRAILAAQTLVADTQVFGSGGRALSFADVTLTFLETLPADDRAADPAANVVCTGACTGLGEDDQRDAAYVRVDLAPRTVSMDFASVVTMMNGGARMAADLAATATAGNVEVACEVVSVMFCVPDTGDDVWNAADHIGHMVVFRSARQNAAWQPGNFGFLDPTSSAMIDPQGPCAGLSNTALWSCLIGATGRTVQCFEADGVDTEPGQRNGVAEAFNVRFDLWRSTMKDQMSNPAYAPAPVVIDGIATEPGNGGQCDETITTADARKPLDPAEQSLGLPRDDCMRPGNTCSGGTVDGENRFGNGIWTTGKSEYLTRNYGASPPTSLTAARTRYDLYRAEIALASGGDTLADPRLETSNPQCNTQVPMGDHDDNSDTADVLLSPMQRAERRTLIAAAVDCEANPFSGRAQGIPVDHFVKFFVTEPMRDRTAGGQTDFDLVGEVVEVVGGERVTGDESFFNIIQLYR